MADTFQLRLKELMQHPVGQDSDAPEQGRQGNLIGVTLHKRTQRFEAHIWQDKKQLYLGSYDEEAQAGRAHDILCLRNKGQAAKLNYPMEQYDDILPLLQAMSQTDVITGLRLYSRSLSAARSMSAPKRVPAPKAPRKPRSVTELSGMQSAYSDALPTIGRKRRMEQIHGAKAHTYDLPAVDLFVRPRTRDPRGVNAEGGHEVNTPSATPGAAAAAHALASMWASIGSDGSPTDPATGPTPAGGLGTLPKLSPLVSMASQTGYPAPDPAEAAAAAANGLSIKLEQPTAPSVGKETIKELLDMAPSPDAAPVQRALSFLDHMQQTLNHG